MLTHLKCHCKAKIKLVQNLKALHFISATLPAAENVSHCRTEEQSKPRGDLPPCKICPFTVWHKNVGFVSIITRKKYF